MSKEREKDKALEDFFEEAVMAVQTVIQFSLCPVKSASKAGGVFENLIRSLSLFGLLAGGFWLYLFAVCFKALVLFSLSKAINGESKNHS